MTIENSFRSLSKTILSLVKMKILATIPILSHTINNRDAAWCLINSTYEQAREKVIIANYIIWQTRNKKSKGSNSIDIITNVAVATESSGFV